MGTGPVGSPVISGASDSVVDRSMLVLYASVSESIGWATASLLEEDVELAERLVAGDREIDERCEQLTGLIKERLAATTPGPDELEYLIAVLQMIPELERSADLAEHVAQRALAGLGGQISPRARGIIQSLCDSGLRMWSLAARAYAERSRDLSFELAELDEEMDELSARLVKEGAVPGVESTVAAELALIARFYERIGDHAVNLARRSSDLAAPRRLVPFRLLRRRSPSTPTASSPLPGPGGVPAPTSAPNPAPGGRGLIGRIRRLRVLPSDGHFFDLFAEAADLARRCSEELVQVAREPAAIEDHFPKIRDLERQSDALTVEVLRLLDATFVTPYDREDIHALAETLDDVVDAMYSAAATIFQMKVEAGLPELLQQAELVRSMGNELAQLIACLRSRDGARMRLERIETFEREGDALLRRTMGRLFGGEFDPLEVMRWKDILQAMEDTMNRIEDAADLVESILVKVA